MKSILIALPLLSFSSFLIAADLTGSENVSSPITEGNALFAKPPTCDLVTQKTVWENEEWKCAEDGYFKASATAPPPPSGLLSLPQPYFWFTDSFILSNCSTYRKIYGICAVPSIILPISPKKCKSMLGRGGRSANQKGKAFNCDAGVALHRFRSAWTKKRTLARMTAKYDVYADKPGNPGVKTALTHCGSKTSADCRRGYTGQKFYYRNKPTQEQMDLFIGNYLKADDGFNPNNWK